MKTAITVVVLLILGHYVYSNIDIETDNGR